MEKKVIFSTKQFDVVQIGEAVGIEPSSLCVAIMPYEKDEKGLPKKIGVLKEFNQLRSGDYSITLVTGNAEGEDPDLLTTAIRALKEESGYDIKTPDSWFYLGMATTSKLVKQEIPCFAVDVTGHTREEKEVVESDDETEFKLVSVKEALASDDVFIPALFMKIFKFIFNFEEKDEPLDIYALKKRLDAKYLILNGVNGSLVRRRNDEDDGEQYIEYTVSELTDNIKSSIPGEVEGIKIVVTEIKPE